MPRTARAAIGGICYHVINRGSGHIWQGRFKAFPVQQDLHLLTVLRYVERNPLRARLVRRAENWQWSSLHGIATRRRPEWLVNGPVDRPRGWTERVHRAETAEELTATRANIRRGTPFGRDGWVHRIAGRLGLESSLNARGRPRKEPDRMTAFFTNNKNLGESRTERLAWK